MSRAWALSRTPPRRTSHSGASRTKNNRAVKELEGKECRTGGRLLRRVGSLAMHGQGNSICRSRHKPMPITDQATFPQGSTRWAPWAPTPALMTKYRKERGECSLTRAHIKLYRGDVHAEDGAGRQLPGCGLGPDRHGCRGASTGTYPPQGINGYAKERTRSWKAIPGSCSMMRM